MPQWLSIALPVVAGLIALLLVIRLVFRSVDRKLRRMVDQRFDRAQMIQAAGANLMGQRSRPGGGIKGKGALVLTGQQLWFGLAVPEREQSIPIAAIRSVSLPKSFMGRTIFRELLCVRFDSPAGEDEIAWAVREPNKWRQALETVRTAG